MTVIYNMSIDRADKPWIGDRRFTEMFMCKATAVQPASAVRASTFTALESAV